MGRLTGAGRTRLIVVTQTDMLRRVFTWAQHADLVAWQGSRGRFRRTLVAAVDAIVLLHFYLIFRGQLASKFDGWRPFHPFLLPAMCQPQRFVPKELLSVHVVSKLSIRNQSPLRTSRRMAASAAVRRASGRASPASRGLVKYPGGRSVEHALAALVHGRAVLADQAF